MVKICFVIPSMKGGGAEKMIMNIANYLDKRRYEVKVILFWNEGHNLDKLDKQIEIIDLKSNLNILGLLKLIWMLKVIECDLILTSLGPLNALISPFLYLFKNKKIIARETNVPSIIHKLQILKGKKIYRIIDVLYKYTYRNYDLIIAQSDDMKNDLIRNYKISEKKIIKINNLIDEKLIDSLIDEELNYDKEKINILCIGRLSYQKGFDLLIKQLQYIKNLDLKVTILGDGEEKESLIKLAKDLHVIDKITFVGFDKNPFKFLKKTDVFLFPSRVEGFPNSLIEALACGVPAIASTSKGGINEIIKSEFNGEIYDFETEVNLEEVIKKVLKYNRKNIQDDTRKKYRKGSILKQYNVCLDNLREGK